MALPAVIDRETGEILTPAPSVTLGVIHGESPKGLTAVATEAAEELARVIHSRKLYSDIQGKRYVRCEGWTTLATMMGVLPREVSVARREDGSYEAVVELVRIADGVPLTRASAECGMDEPTWAGRANYARRSMAVTRATSKVCRIAFSWVMALAGYEVTPAEEIPADEGEPRLPGAAEKWDGHGGQPISKVPSEVLTKVRNWLDKKDSAKNAALVAAIDAEIDGRRDTT